MRRMRSVLLCVAIMLAGCSVGPDYRPRQPPHVMGYTKAGAGGDEAEAYAPALSRGADIPARWWAIYHSRALDRVIRMGLNDSPTLAAAKSTLRAAQEDYAAQSGTILYPQADALLASTRRKLSGVAFGQGGDFIYTLHDASVRISYAITPFGAGSRYLESLRAGIDIQGYQLEAAHLALTANIVTTAVREASLREQLQAARDIAEKERQQLAIVERQASLGAATREDVLRQRTALARARAALPALQGQLARAHHRLATLAGRFPNSEALPAFRLSGFHMPDTLPLSLPSQLVRQRPDIRAAEAELHQASALVGLATANLYPSFSIDAGFGRQAVKFADLLSGPASTIWSLGGSMLQPLFHGGELSAKRRQALASFDAARARYRQVLLTAFQNVADVLLALRSDAESLGLREKLEAIAVKRLKIVQRQFTLGAASFPSLLTAQRQFRQSHIEAVRARAALLADTAALFQAMGGGWWHRKGAYTPVAEPDGRRERPAVTDMEKSS